MKLLLKSFLFILLIIMSSCRPPEIESVVIEYNGARYDAAYELALIAVQKHPGNAEAWYYMGELYGKKEMFAEMMDAFKKANSLDAQYEQKSAPAIDNYFATVFNRGVSSFNNFNKSEDRDSEKAQKLIQSALLDFQKSSYIKNDARSNQMIAMTYSAVNDNDNALKYYKIVTEIEPENIEGWSNLGNFYFILQDLDNAVLALEKAYELDSNNAQAITFLSQIYDLKGQTDKAVSFYEKAIAMNPQEKAFPFNLALIYIKQTYGGELDDVKKADLYNKSVIYFSKTIEIDPQVKDAYVLKSTAELQNKKFEDAKNTALAGLAIFPDEADLFSNLAVAYSNLGMKKEAEAAYEKAKSLGAN